MSDDNYSEINIIYNINNEYINIFGSEFVRNNKNICKMIIGDKEYIISEYYRFKDYKKDKLRIKLKGIDKVTDMHSMFYGCSSLLSLPDISKWKTNNIIDMCSIFDGCSSLSTLPDIYKWNNKNVTNIGYMFCGCSSLFILWMFVIIIFT